MSSKISNEIRNFMIDKFSDSTSFDSLCIELEIGNVFTGDFDMRITSLLQRIEKEYENPVDRLYKSLLKLRPHFKSEIDNLFSHNIVNVENEIQLMKERIINLEEKINQHKKNKDSHITGEDIFIGLSGEASCHNSTEQLLRKAHRFILIGTGINILSKYVLTNELFRRAAHDNCDIEIYLGNPLSPYIEVRLIEEELGQPLFEEIKPRVGKYGLIERIETLIDIWKENGHPDNVSIKCFNNYPTFALFIITIHAVKTYLFYPYGFARLGNYSPVLKFTNRNREHKEIINFFDKQYERIKKTSIDAGDMINIYNREYNLVNKFHAFALYYIPDADSDLFHFGTKILGYNVYTENETESSYTEYNKKSRKFGLHVTICDVLYFIGSFEIQEIENEIAYIWQEYKDIELSGLRIEKNNPDKGTLSIMFHDTSRKLEALHNELVQRVYRRSAGSDYNIGSPSRIGDIHTEQNKFMIERYKAPFIMSSFIPHFTLLTEIPQEKIDDIYNTINTKFLSDVRYYAIKIKELSIMNKKPDGFWKISRKI
ncbi:MAG: hypothetical protein JXB88_04490 [Spirochaetales bacterium]|nr:hypothetical protein [Spirochaetales bacterium]